MIKVAIANDTLIALEALRRAISVSSAYQLIWVARDGAEAVDKAEQNPPDLILMDLLMPNMDGVEATRQIMAHSPCAILIVTGSVKSNTSRVFEAMGCGALDVVQTPTIARSVRHTGSADAVQTAAQPLLAKMMTVSKVIGKYDRSIRSGAAIAGRNRPCIRSHQLIVIGASTGGPKALAKILSQLPRALPAAILIVQHIDAQFVGGLSEWLNAQSRLPVRIAVAGDRPQKGEILLSGTSGHLSMKRDRSLTYLAANAPEAQNTVYLPSVDVLFKSVAKYWRSPGQAVLLTGMGKDGAVGLDSLRLAGWHTIAESQQSCVVYGMPRAAVEIGAADSVLSSEQIASELVKMA